MAQRVTYIWQQSAWPSLQFDDAAVARDLTQARRQQGILLGQARMIGLTELDQIVKDIWIEDTLATAAIEGAAVPDLVRRNAAKVRWQQP